MHDNATKDKFVELRAQGLTLDAISAQIGVPTATLGRWNHHCLDQISRLRALQWHLLEDQIGHRFEVSLQRIAQRIRRLEDQLDLDTQEPKQLSQPALIRLIRQSHLDYLRLRSVVMTPLQRPRGNIWLGPPDLPD